MGAVSFSLDRKLVESLKASLPLDVLVETGTFEGNTVAEVRDLFTEIHSVELSDQLPGLLVFGEFRLQIDRTRHGLLNQELVAGHISGQRLTRNLLQL